MNERRHRSYVRFDQILLHRVCVMIHVELKIHGSGLCEFKGGSVDSFLP
jgi:hypothetical protein